VRRRDLFNADLMGIRGLWCHLPRAWDHFEGSFATVMGPLGCQ
jgi:hypothetical protein